MAIHGVHVHPQHCSPNVDLKQIYLDLHLRAKKRYPHVFLYKDLLEDLIDFQ